MKCGKCTLCNAGRCVVQTSAVDATAACSLSRTTRRTLFRAARALLREADGAGPRQTVVVTDASVCAGGGHIRINASVDGVTISEVFHIDDLRGTVPHRERLRYALAEVLLAENISTMPDLADAVAGEVL